MNRNIPAQIADAHTVQVKAATTALLGVSSQDRYTSHTQQQTKPSSPYKFSLYSAQNYANGFFTQVALTEIRFPWTIPTFTSNNNQLYVDIRTVAGVQAGPTLITIPTGWYNSSSVGAALQTAIQALGGLFANVTTIANNYQQLVITPGAAAGAGAWVNFGEYSGPDPTRTTAYGMLNLYPVVVSPSAGNVWTTGVLNLIRTNFIDIVCNQLTYHQDVKDGDTGSVVRDIVCRLYLTPSYPQIAGGIAGATLTNATSGPFIVHTDFNTPKQIKWTPIQPLGAMVFEVYDDQGLPLTTGSLQGYDGNGDALQGDWNLTLQLTEV